MKVPGVLVIVLAVLAGTAVSTEGGAATGEGAVRPQPESVASDGHERETVLATRADSLAFAQVSRRVGKRSEVRVKSTSGIYELRAPLLTVAGVPVAGSDGSSDETIPWSGVQRLDVRGSAAGRGAAIGAFLVGGLGLAGALAMTGECSGEPFSMTPCELEFQDVVAVTAASAVAGAVLGMVVSAPFSRWKTVYEASR